jgi:hypothetical protein
MDASSPSAASSLFSVFVTTNTSEECCAVVTQDATIQQDVPVNLVTGGATNTLELLSSLLAMARLQTPKTMPSLRNC